MKKADNSLIKVYEGNRKEGLVVVQITSQYYEGEYDILVNISLSKNNNES